MRRVVVKETDGPGRLLGYRAFHKKIRELHGLNVPRNLVYNVMADVNPKGLEERGGAGQPKRARRKTAFTPTVRILGQYITRTADYGLRTTDNGQRTTDYGLRTTDYGLRTTDYGRGIKHGLKYKTRTKHYGLGIKYGLRFKTRTEHHGLARTSS